MSIMRGFRVTICRTRDLRITLLVIYSMIPLGTNARTLTHSHLYICIYIPPKASHTISFWAKWQDLQGLIIRTIVSQSTQFLLMHISEHVYNKQNHKNWILIFSHRVTSTIHDIESTHTVIVTATYTATGARYVGSTRTNNSVFVVSIFVCYI